MIDPIAKIGDFTLLMMTLCGNKEHKYENRVLELLRDYNGSDLGRNDEYSDKNLLQIILIRFEDLTIRIEKNILSD